MQRGFSAIIVLVALVAMIVVAGGLFYAGRLTAPKTEPQQATQRVKSTPSSTDNPNLQPLPSSQTTTQKDETANWRTYTNDKFGVSFKYPATYTVTEYGGSGVFFTRTDAEKQSLEDCFSRKQPECNNYPLRISFDKPERNPNLDLKSFVAMYTHSDTSGYVSTTVSGFPALQSQFEGIGLVNNIYIDEGKYILYVQGNSIIDAQQNMDTFNKILTTFKLTQ